MSWTFSRLNTCKIITPSLILMMKFDVIHEGYEYINWLDPLFVHFIFINSQEIFNDDSIFNNQFGDFDKIADDSEKNIKDTENCIMLSQNSIGQNRW